MDISDDTVSDDGKDMICDSEEKRKRKQGTNCSPPPCLQQSLLWQIFIVNAFAIATKAITKRFIYAID